MPKKSPPAASVPASPEPEIAVVDTAPAAETPAETLPAPIAAQTSLAPDTGAMEAQLPAPAEPSAADKLRGARDFLARLIAKRDEITKHRQAIATRREKIAHLALADGDAAAQRELDELTIETIRAAADLENFSAAIAAAERAVKGAEHDVELAEEIQRAWEAKFVILERQELAKSVSKMLATIAESQGKYIQLGRQLGELTRKHTGSHFDPYALEQAFLTAMNPLVRDRLIRLPYPDPPMRRPLEELATQADRIHAQWVASIIKKNPTTDEVEAAAQAAMEEKETA